MSPPLVTISKFTAELHHKTWKTKSRPLLIPIKRDKLLLGSHSISYFVRGRGAKYCNEYVCLSVSLSVCLPACVLPIAVAWSSSGGVAICYILPFFGWRHIYAMTRWRIMCIPTRRQAYQPRFNQILLNDKDRKYS